MHPLETFAKTRDECAFRALVDAHLGMVFGTAMRRLGDRGLSEEVAQNVFNALAKKAKTIRSANALPAWLHRAVVLECSKAIRGETRRRQRMEKLIEITALEGEGLAAWKHATPDLDEAVDELPAADREILFQRFYEDKSFREIAEASGKSEAASQKQASRAIAKLGELMRARGFAVPATVLATGLGAELCKAAPAKLAATISSTALASATATSFSLFGIMSMTKSTAAGFAVAALLIAAFTGGGYLSGRSSARAEHASAASRSEPGTTVDRGVPEFASGGNVTATPKQTRGTVREILQTAADHFAAAFADPEVSSERRRDESERGRRQIAKLRPDEIDAALAELAMLDIDEKIRERTRWEIVKHWARSAGPEAAAFALENAPGDYRYMGVNSALSGWTEHSPAEAYAWYQEVNGADASEIDADHKRSFLRTILRAWGAKDPAAMLGAFAVLPYDEQRNQIHSLGSLAEKAVTRAPYLEALRNYPEPKIQAQLIEDAMDDWSKLDPPAAAQWFDSVEFDSPELAFKPASELAENWFERDARAAVDWFFDKIPDHMREEFVTELVREEWAEKDPESAAAWLKENGFDNKASEIKL